MKKADAISRALLFGSAQKQDAVSRRSDVDAVVVIDERKKGQAHKLLSGLHSEAKEMHIPTQFVICTESSFRFHNHSLRPLLCDHLARCAATGGVIKGDFSEAFARNPDAASVFREETLQYLSRRAVQLYSLRIQFDDLCESEQAKALKKTIETARNVARKAVQVHFAEQGLPDEPDPLNYGTIRNAGAASVFEDLIRLDSLYSAQLASQFRASFDESAYRDVLGRIRSAMPKVIDFIETNISLLSR